MKIVLPALGFNPILAQERLLPTFCGLKEAVPMLLRQRPPHRFPRSIGAYQYPPPIPPPPDVPPPVGEEFCVMPPPPELSCPVVEQAETLRPMRAKNTAEKMVFINM
jgi:hypothetical protein